MMESLLPILPVTVMLVGAYLVPLLRRRGTRVSVGITIACSTIALGAAAYMLYLNSVGTVVRYQAGGWAPPIGIEVRVGPLDSFMAATIVGVGLLVLVWTVSGLGSELHPQAVPLYYTVFLLTMAGMIGMAFAADMFNMYVFLEVTGLGACALVAAKGDRKSTSAAFKYLILNCVGSCFVLFAIGMVYLISGNLNFEFIRYELAGAWVHFPRLQWVTLSFFLVGFGIKAALFPLHVWLPDAHSSATTASSAVLSGLVVKIYAFTFIKILSLLLVGEGLGLAWPVLRTVMLIMSAAAIIGGSGFALVQTHVKRILAYSTVAQIGYIFLGLALGTVTGFVIAVFHILAHALMKSCLFLSAGTVAQRTGAKKVADYDGMGRRMPVTMACFSVAALSMIGIPGFAGLISKWYLATGAMVAGMPWCVALMVISGILNACYYLPILERAYFRPCDHGRDEAHAPLSILTPILLLAAGCVALGLFPSWLLGLIARVVPVLGL